MVCIYCSGHLSISSIWFCNQYSYICYCVNEHCKEYLVKFKKNCKYPSEINACKNFDLTRQ